MSDVTDRCGSRGRLDPRKRVNYSLGLVLGEDEFVQEQFHLRERDHLRVRALHGYGTVSGLAVTWDEDTAQLRVAPGVAVDPVGRLVCVPTEQCADLGRWLTDHREEMVEELGLAEGELPDELSLYVALCYRECLTDDVPVPSETCRTGEESMAASRVMESFELRLLFAPPGPAGELIDDALPTAVASLLDLVDDLPEDPDTDLAELRRALIAWATTDRPELEERPCLKAPDDDCDATDGPSTAVLLARVDLEITGGAQGPIAAVDPEVADDDRPVLLSTRFLQEWLTGLLGHPDLFAPSDHSVLENLDADDHPQYLLADGSRPMTGNLNAGGNQLRNIGRSGAGTHAMRRNEIVGLDLGLDDAGLRVEALQGERLDASGDSAPTEGDVLRYEGGRWVPAALTIPEPPDLPEAPPTPTTVLPFVTIELLGRQRGVASFLLWFNLDAPDSRVALGPAAGRRAIPLVYGEGLEVFTESCNDEGEPSLRRVETNLAEVRQISCTTFRFDMNRQAAEFLRFRFHLPLLRLTTGETVAEHARDRGITWVGQGEGDTVTKFVVNPSEQAPFDGFEGIDSIVFPSGGGRIPIERR